MNLHRLTPESVLVTTTLRSGLPGPSGLSSGPGLWSTQPRVFPATESFACISEAPSGLTVTLQADHDVGMSVASQTGLPSTPRLSAAGHQPHTHWKVHLVPCGARITKRPVTWKHLHLRFFQWSCVDVRVRLQRKLSAEELMLSNWCWRRLFRLPWTAR